MVGGKTQVPLIVISQLVCRLLGCNESLVDIFRLFYSDKTDLFYICSYLSTFELIVLQIQSKPDLKVHAAPFGASVESYAYL